jgi:AcrR family transcriptional regulator
MPGSRAARSTRGALTRDRILEAALALADAEGIEALSMRRIGTRLGVEGMSLYRHVADKADLLDGLVDLVYARIELPPPDGPRRAWLRARAIAVHRALVEHPWATALMESRVHPGPSVLGHHEAVLAVLLGSGLDGSTATRAYNLLDSYIYGFAIQQVNLPFGSAEELATVGTEMLDALPMDDYPNLARVARDLIGAGFDYAAEFESGLDLVLDAIETLDRPSRGRARRAGVEPLSR